MAQRLPDGHVVAPRTGRTPFYPWGQWADGSAWRIRHGEDFDVPLSQMRNNLYSHAKRNGSLVSVLAVDTETLEFQFREVAPEPETAA